MLVSVSSSMLLAGVGSWMFGLVFVAFVVFVLACFLWLHCRKSGHNLRAGNNVDVPREGRKARIKHKNGFSDSDSKGGNLERPERKKVKEKDPDTILSKREANEKRGGPLYPVLKEFAGLDRSEEELDPQEEEELEKAASGNLNVSSYDRLGRDLAAKQDMLRKKIIFFWFELPRPPDFVECEQLRLQGQAARRVCKAANTGPALRTYRLEL